MTSNNLDLPSAVGVSQITTEGLDQKLQTPPTVHTEKLLAKIFRGITQKINNGIAYETILDFVFDSMSLVISFDRIGIALIEGEGKNTQLCLKWVRSKLPILHLGKKYCAILEGSSLQNVFETGKPRIINDLRVYAEKNPQSRSTQLALSDGVRSSLTCPLRANNKNVGMVFFSSGKTNTYKQEDIQVFLEIADELSVIVEHGQLKKYFENYISATQNMRMTIHDLRSPLSVIQGLLELTPFETWYSKLSMTEKNIFSVMQRNTKYMFELLRELSELRNLDTEVYNLNIEDVNMEKFCQELLTNAKESASKKNIELKLILDSKCKNTFRFDSLKIYRVLDNLLTNAFKFSNTGTQVTLDINAVEQRLVFKVIDQGQGIPQNEIPKLFKEFGKTTVQPTNGEVSTGLGLAIASKILEQHKGKIEVVSEVGKGSTFIFWIPILKNL